MCNTTRPNQDVDVREGVGDGGGWGVAHSCLCAEGAPGRAIGAVDLEVGHPGAMGGHGGRLRSTLARGSTEGEEVERTVAFGPLLSIVIPTSDTQK